MVNLSSTHASKKNSASLLKPRIRATSPTTTLLLSLPELKLNNNIDVDIGSKFSESCDSHGNYVNITLPLHSESESEHMKFAWMEDAQTTTRTAWSSSSTNSDMSVQVELFAEDGPEPVKYERKMVRFSSCLVTEVHIVPRRTDEDVNRCFFSGHELQR